MESGCCRPWMGKEKHGGIVRTAVSYKMHSFEVSQCIVIYIPYHSKRSGKRGTPFYPISGCALLSIIQFI